jgi:ABC-type glycerol-3-phosphate transport system substrate-binding protein
MRLQRYFALSLVLLTASLGCSSNSGQTQQQPAAPAQTAAGQPAPNAPNAPVPPQPATTAAGGSAATTTGGATSPAMTTTASPANAFDACSLLTSDDIKSVQGEAVLEAKPNRRTDSPFAVTQCFYMTPSFTKSVSLEVTQRGASTQSVHDFWKTNFERAEDKREKKNERRKLKGKPLAGEPAVPVKGIGDEAYWISTNANSTLYAFKKDALVRISIGGTDAEEARMKKIKTLVEKALARL